MLRVVTPASGVGQDKKPLSLLACADFSRAKESCCNRVTQSLKVFSDLSKPKSKVPWDVFEKHQGRAHVCHDVGNVWPQVARVVGSLSFAGNAERLTRVAASDDIHDATPRFAVEGLKVRPDRRCIQGTVRHTRNQKAGGIGFDLHIADRASLRAGKSDTEVDSSVA